MFAKRFRRKALALRLWMLSRRDEVLNIIDRV
jgi:hypothetical protein